MTKIMLVEDDNNLREIYEARLAAEGYDIVSAGDGEAALALAGNERPDMIISDVMMPKISGFEMLDILRNTDKLRDVKIIMLTALGQAEDAERANHLGADRYLVKSQVTLEDIVDTTHELLNDREDAAPEMAPETAAEPATVPDAPVDELASAPAPVVTAPSAPEVMAMPEAPAIVEPSVAHEPAMSIPVAEPAGQDDAAADEPASSPVISIPVADDSSDAAAPSNDSSIPVAAEPEYHPVSNLPITPEAPAQSVVEPPVASEPQEPAAEAAPASDPLDFTSPENFNKFQAAPSSPEMSSTVADTNFSPASAAEPVEPPEPQLSADGALNVSYPAVHGQQSQSQEEDAVKAQIDAFINQQDSVQEAPQLQADDITLPEPPATESSQVTPSAPVSIPVTADEATAPTLQAEPAPETENYSAPQPPMSDPFATNRSHPATVTDEPVPEDLNAFTPPEIQSAPTPADNAAGTDEALVAAAMKDFEDSAAQGAVQSEPQYGTEADKVVVTPSDTANSKPDIDRLLELEAAKNGARQAAAENVEAKPHVDGYNPSVVDSDGVVQAPPEDGDDPDKVAI